MGEMNYKGPPNYHPQVAPELRKMWREQAEKAKALAAESYEIHQKDGPCDCPDCRQYLDRLR